jgi:hypothetical protein
MRPQEEEMERSSGRTAAGDLRGASSSLPDVRGWTVVAADGEAVGRVHDLVMDERSGEARSLDVEVAPALTAGMRRADRGLPLNEAHPPDPARPDPAHRLLDVNPGSGEVYPTGEDPHPRVHDWEPPEAELHEGAAGNHVLVPVDLARIREDEEQVVLEGLRGTDIQEMPPYRPGNRPRK